MSLEMAGALQDLHPQSEAPTPGGPVSVQNHRVVIAASLRVFHLEQLRRAGVGNSTVPQWMRHLTQLAGTLLLRLGHQLGLIAAEEEGSEQGGGYTCVGALRSMWRIYDRVRRFCDEPSNQRCRPTPGGMRVIR